ncbi:MAG: serine hydrolase domain-containing protein [bacterium]
MNRRAVALLLLCCSSSLTWADQLDDYIAERMTASHTPAIVFGVFRDGKMLRKGAYGYSSLELGVKANTDNVFEIGSVSKQFTATILLKLREEGKVELSDRIDKYVPGLPETWKAIPLRNLLNHTSGIPDIEEIFGYDSYRNIYTTKQIIDVANSRPIEFQPGQKWHYSNTNYYLLGLVLEKIEGKTYEQILKDRITKPLGLDHTRISNPTDIIPNRCAGYMFDNGVVTNRDAMQQTACLGAGTIVSTIEDMAKWDEAINHNRVITKESQQMMWEKTPMPTGFANYGFAWFVEDFRGKPNVSHSGGTAGFSCDYRRFSDGLSVMVFSNLYANDVGDIEFRAVDSVQPGFSYLTSPAIADDPVVTKRLLAAMADVASGKPSSPLVTEGQFKTYTDASRKVWKERLDTLKSIVLVESTKYAPEDSGRGDKVVETRVYRLETGSGPVIVQFKLTADGRVGFQQRLMF